MPVIRITIVRTTLALPHRSDQVRVEAVAQPDGEFELKYLNYMDTHDWKPMSFYQRRDTLSEDEKRAILAALVAEWNMCDGLSPLDVNQCRLI